MTTYIQSKLPNAGTSIFTEMSVLAQEHSAINLGQGFPDFEMNPTLAALVADAMRQGKNQYVHTNGLPALRQSISEKIEMLHQQSVGTEAITITPGGTYAIYTALTTILQKGDEVIIFEPAYDSYVPNIEINGGVPVAIPLSFPGYSIDWNLVKSRINKKTKAIILNSPHNPTGAVLSEEDMANLSALVQGTGIFIVSDEVYEHLIFDGKEHNSVLKYPELYKRSFACFSFGKTYHCTGWKLGYCVAPVEHMKEFRKVHQFNCFSCFSPAQFALAEFLRHANEFRALGSFMQQKRDFFAEEMKATRFTSLPSFGSYFQLYSYGAFSDETEKELAIRITREFGVASIPVSAFYQSPVENKVLRFCFAKKEETLKEAAKRLSNV